MYSCDHGDSIVVHIDRVCPMCDLEGQIKDLEKRLESLQEDSAYFEEKSIELEDQLNKLTKERSTNG